MVFGHRKGDWGTTDCNPRSIYAVEGPIAVLSAYPLSLAAARAYYISDEHPGLKLFYYTVTHTLVSLLVTYSWRMFAPKMWSPKTFYIYTLALALSRLILTPICEYAVEKASIPVALCVVIFDAITIVLGFYVIPSVLYFKNYDFWPGFHCLHALTWLIFVMFFLFFVIIICAHMMRSLYEILIFANVVYITLIGIATVLLASPYRRSTGTHTPAEGEQDKLKPFYYPATLMGVYFCSYGVYGVLHSVRFVRDIMDSDYRAEYGFLLFYIFVTLGVLFVELFIDILPSTNKEELTLPLVMFQFFQEFVIMICYLDAGFSSSFILFTCFIVLYNVMTETGLIYEKFYDTFLDQSNKFSTTERAAFLAKKFILIRQKRFADLFALPALAAVILLEYLFGDMVGVTLITAHQTQRAAGEYEPKAIMSAFLILYVLLLATQHVSAYWFQKRMYRCSVQVSSGQFSGQLPIKHSYASAKMIAKGESSHRKQRTEEHKTKKSVSFAPDVPSLLLNTSEISVKVNTETSEPTETKASEPMDARMSEPRTQASESTGSQAEALNPTMRQLEGSRRRTRGKGSLESDALLEGKHVEETDEQSSGRARSPSADKAHKRMTSLRDQFPVLSITVPMSNKAYLERNGSNRIVYIVGCLLAMLVGLRWYEPSLH
ncbi:hypothetical protein AAMO2058_000301300 [Amorphochlora amoebiformis]